MKQEIKFEVCKEGKEIVWKQIVEKRMKLNESVAELNKLKQEMQQLQHQLLQMNEAIKVKKLETDRDAIKSQIGNLDKAGQDWTNLIKPLVDALRKDLKRKVKKAKIKTGYDRVKDVNMKIVRQNEILAPLCEKFDIAIDHPMMMEVKGNFDKI